MALETTLLVHGVPRASARGLAGSLADAVRAEGATPVFVGVHGGRAVVGLTDAELGDLIDGAAVEKANTANLGVLMFRGGHAATTVSTTAELAAAAGVRVSATGGTGGIHPGYGRHLDISADLLALARHPVAVVSGGVKSLLDVEATREALEALGVPVVGFGTDRLPLFVVKGEGPKIDGRFDREEDLARFVGDQLAETGRGVLVVQPPPDELAVAMDEWTGWLAAARARVGSGSGRDETPRILAAVHELSRGATLRANLGLVVSNARLAARISALLPESDPPTR